MVKYSTRMLKYSLAIVLFLNMPTESSADNYVVQLVPRPPGSINLGTRLSQVHSMRLQWAVNANPGHWCCLCPPATECAGLVVRPLELDIGNPFDGQGYCPGRIDPQVAGFSTGEHTFDLLYCLPHTSFLLDGQFDFLGPYAIHIACSECSPHEPGPLPILELAFLLIDADPLLQGDMNGDQKVTGEDISLFTDTFLSSQQASRRSQLAADCNLDDVVDLEDVGPFVAILLSGFPLP